MSENTTTSADANHERFIRDFVAHRKMLNAFVLSLCGDYDLAEEIFQEVSIVLWRKFEQFKTGTNFGAWSREVAYREVLAARRKRARGLGAGKALVLCDDDVMERILAAYRRADEEDQETEIDRVDALRACLRAIGESARKILRMRYEHRMPSRRIAEQLKRSAGAVDVELHRLRVRLARCIESKLETEGVVS